MYVRRHNSNRPQRGFTIIELMIVILIISLLLLLVVPLVSDVLGTSRAAATRTTVKKIHELLQKRQDAFNRDFPKWFKRTRGRDYQPFNIHDIRDRKAKFMAMFLVVDPQQGIGRANTLEENAKRLYELLTKQETFGTAAADSSEFTGTEILIDPNDNRPYFVDSWGEPIVYYPYPTRLFRPEGPGAPITNADYEQAKLLYGGTLPPRSELEKDPDDQAGLLTPQPNTPNLSEQEYHTVSTYHSILVVSKGGDRELGLYEPNDPDGQFWYLAHPNPTKTAQLHDNITNFNIRAGAN